VPEVLAAIALPGCKSSSQRALMLAALAGGESRIEGLSDCQDSADLLAALQALGAKISPPAHAGQPHLLHGQSPQDLLTSDAQRPDVPVGEGASTLRFLLALTAAGRGAVTLRPAPALAARPHGELIEILRGFGAAVETSTDHRGPLMRVRGAGGFGPREVQVGALQSSQTLSALWLAAGDAPMRWRLQPGAGSHGYLTLTAHMLREARGAAALIEQEEGRCWEQAAGFGANARLQVLADPSAVLFFAVAAILLDRPLLLDRAWNPLHADARLLDWMRAEGWISWSKDSRGVTVTPGPSAGRRDLILNLDAAPDGGPVLAVLAAHLPGGGRFSGLDRLRIKESDRVAAMMRLAEGCGASAVLTAGFLTIRPGATSARLGQAAARRSAVIGVAGDHRTAMAAGIASLLHPGLEPDDHACVAKSFPHFWAALAPLHA
jgi:3-phosphoshikimate 1-carboxyvinyltransferase